MVLSNDIISLTELKIKYLLYSIVNTNVCIHYLWNVTDHIQYKCYEISEWTIDKLTNL